jgi:diaminopimelate decarboxylase
MTVAVASQAASCGGAQPLTARLEPWMRDLLASGRLPDLVERFGSPVNLQSTGPFRRNLQALQGVARQRGLSFKPYFARKANKCLSYVETARDLGFGVDTASHAEVEQCLRYQVPGGDIVCTATVKNEALLRLCVDHGVALIIDNDDELELLARVAESAGRRPLIGLRISGFHHGRERLHSRFGFSIDDLPALIGRFRTVYADVMDLAGLHFHLNGYDADHRISALRQILPFAEELGRGRDQAFFIDIGGGMPMRYLEDRQQWQAWLDAHGRALLGKGEPITKNNHALGRSVLAGEVVGRIDAYPTGHDLVQERWLAHILDAADQHGTLAAALSASRIELPLRSSNALSRIAQARHHAADEQNASGRTLPQ